MQIIAKLGLGFAAAVVLMGLAGGITLRELGQLHDADQRVRERVAFHELTLQYRHAVTNASLGAAQLGSGHVLAEQRVREALDAAARSRASIEQRALPKAARRNLADLVRLEKLTAATIERAVALVDAQQPAPQLKQELALLAARSDALELGMEALVEDSLAEREAALTEAAALAGFASSRIRQAVALAIALSLLAAALAVRSIALPLRALSRGVQAMTEGKLEGALPVISADEVGRAAEAINVLAAQLRASTDALASAQRNLTAVVAHVQQGILTLRRDGSTLPERSALLDSWLGYLSPDVALWDALRREQPAFAEALRRGFAVLLESEGREELALDQLPQLLLRNGRQLEIAYHAVLADAKIDMLLVTITDASERVARELASAHERVAMAVFRAMQRDKPGFLDFVEQGSELLSSLDAEPPDPRARTRHLHTLKVGASSFELPALSEACHQLESALADGADAGSKQLWAALAKHWTELCAIIASASGDARSRIELDDDDYSELLEAVMQGKPRAQIASMVASWRMERVDERLLRLGDQARALATRLGKGELQVQVNTGGLRLPRDTFASFWSALPHALRNSVQHGFESGAERLSRGKPESPTLTLRTSYVDEELRVEVTDDGRGIDWGRIGDQARLLGKPAESQDDLVEALFADGLSTSEGVSEVSGRGVGLAALRAACARLAGRIVIDSTPGAGTTLAFYFPLEITRDAAAIEVASHIPLESLTPRADEQASVPL